jgi:hypothetical protein
MKARRKLFSFSMTAITLACGCALLADANAQAPVVGGNGKLLLTGGVSTIDGAAGGGLTPWAVTGTYASNGQLGLSAFGTRVRTSDYALSGYGAALSYGDRVEFSVAAQDFDTGPTGRALGLPGLRLKQNIVGAKVRVAGDAILDSDSFMPQIAVGVLYKDLDAGGFAPTVKALGAEDTGTDIYISATKLFLAQSFLVNLSLRATKANQNGLLGFGGTASDSYEVMPELSLAYLISRKIAIGAEYRAKPDNLNPSILGNGLKEDDWSDVFLAWAPTKNVSLTLAYVDLGKIVPAVVQKRQTGAYLSAQLAF